MKGVKHVRPCECATCSRAREQAAARADAACAREMSFIVRSLVNHFVTRVRELEAQVRELGGVA